MAVLLMVCGISNTNTSTTPIDRTAQHFAGSNLGNHTWRFDFGLQHAIKVQGQNAANRLYVDTRVLIQPDINGDGSVNDHDLLDPAGAWGDCACVEDLSGNARWTLRKFSL